NRIPDDVRERIRKLALEEPALSPREHGRFLANPSGGPTWISATTRSPAYVRGTVRANLCAAHQHHTAARCAASCHAIQIVECFGRGLWRSSERDHGRHHPDGNGGHLEELEVEPVDNCRADGSVFAHRHHVPLRESSQGLPWR